MKGPDSSGPFLLCILFVLHNHSLQPCIATRKTLCLCCNLPNPDAAAYDVALLPSSCNTYILLQDCSSLSLDNYQSWA